MVDWLPKATVPRDGSRVRLLRSSGPQVKHLELVGRWIGRGTGGHWLIQWPNTSYVFDEKIIGWLPYEEDKRPAEGGGRPTPAR